MKFECYSNLQIFGNNSYINSYPFRSPVQSVEKILLSVMSMIAEPNINRYKIHIVQRIGQNVYNKTSVAYKVNYNVIL